MAQDVPPEVAAVGLDDWFGGLNDPNKVKVRRYLKDIDTSSEVGFMYDLMERSRLDHNYKLSVVTGEYATKMDLDDYGMFRVVNGYIEGLCGAEMYDEAKKMCCENLDRFPAVKDRLISENGGEVPKDLACRNKLIDVMVGIDMDYDGAYEALDMFAEIGIMPLDELPYRKQSLKIHRMQRTFDNIFMYRPSE